MSRYLDRFPKVDIESTPTSGETTTTYEVVLAVYGKEFADKLFEWIK